jgi:hypothetical protein
MSLVVRLLLDGPLGEGFRLEPLVRDRQAALDRPAIGALGEALFGATDGGELLAEVGRESDRNRLGVERAGGVFVLPGLLALERPIGVYLADLICQQGFDSRSLASHEFTSSRLIHDCLQLRPVAPAR